jgi:hypothetical protein
MGTGSGPLSALDFLITTPTDRIEIGMDYRPPPR